MADELNSIMTNLKRNQIKAQAQVDAIMDLRQHLKRKRLVVYDVGAEGVVLKRLREQLNQYEEAIEVTERSKAHPSREYYEARVDYLKELLQFFIDYWRDS